MPNEYMLSFGIKFNYYFCVCIIFIQELMHSIQNSMAKYVQTIKLEQETLKS